MTSLVVCQKCTSTTYIEEYNDETFYEKCNTLNEVHIKINTLKTNQKNIFIAFQKVWNKNRKIVFLLMDQETVEKVIYLIF